MQKNGETTERRESFFWEGMACENLVGISMYEGYMETVQNTWVNISLDFITKLQKCIPSGQSRSTIEERKKIRHFFICPKTGDQARTG